MDDPLRVVRCVRFASRFGFEMVPELRMAAKDEEIQVCIGFILCSSLVHHTLARSDNENQPRAHRRGARQNDERSSMHTRPMSRVAHNYIT